MKKYFNLASFYLIIGLISGVFYREFTKLNGFEGKTVLNAIHSHAIMLGGFFFLIFMLLERQFKFSSIKSFKGWLITYNVGLIYVLITFVMRGVMQVKGIDMNGFSHIAGLGHAILGIAIVWFVILGNQALKQIKE